MLPIPNAAASGRVGSLLSRTTAANRNLAGAGAETHDSTPSGLHSPHNGTLKIYCNLKGPTCHRAADI
ncbi:hypothetical protein NPX13_g1616 [Xylaria arbuscula]|uniref:Uncharacterized protein n=1 Tax=Xylaria arbuscula TaxID=114810 RepID=A0A9W8TR56_9PEZI|nr:hypothetical protein NPX13_g1616 [Xylaria arbuscula]